MVIERLPVFYGTHKQGSLSPSLNVSFITDRLCKIRPERGSGDGKTRYQWYFRVTMPDGVTHDCAIWDYKGERWSTFGPDAVFANAFGDAYKPGVVT